MTKKESFPSRKGNRRKFCRKVIGLLITFLISIFIIFGTNIIVHSSSGLEVSAQENKFFEPNIVQTYAKNLEERGYENVSYELSYLVKFAKENNLPLRPSISNGISIEEGIIKMYDYYTTYYSVQIGEKDYLFKSENEANNFIQTINKYDGQEYTIKTTTKIVENETEQNEINDTIEIKKKEYEEAQAKAAAEAEAKRKAEEEARRQVEQTKPTTTYNSSSYSLSALQSYAYDLVINSYGWSEEDFNALVDLWNRESGWNPNSHNSSSGAHGIPQALPASKMASEGGDYYTNGETQIRWGLKYIAQRYGSPLNAWSHSQSVGWY